MCDFHTSATDVHNHRGGTCNIDAVDCSKMNQARFFNSRYHSRPDPCFALHEAEEFPPVFGFPDGARRSSQNLFDLMGLGEPPEPRKGLESGVHCLLGQGLAVQSTRAEAHHFLLAIDDLEREIGSYSDHDHVNGICTAVDGRYAHLFGK